MPHPPNALGGCAVPPDIGGVTLAKIKIENVVASTSLGEELDLQARAPLKKSPETEVQNIVASSALGTEINLNAIAISLGLEKVEYEPEQFPGLVYRIDEPKGVVLLFGGGPGVSRNEGGVEWPGGSRSSTITSTSAPSTRESRPPSSSRKRAGRQSC